MDIEKIIINGDITVITKDIPEHLPETSLKPDPGEVESVSFRLTDGNMAQFDITDRGEGWIRFDSRQCLGKSAWNKNGSTEGDILESDLQKYLDTKIYALIPTWLAEMIMETKRKNTNGEEYRTWLFAPDASEVFGADEGMYETRYQRLPYYEKAYNRIKADIKDEEYPVNWWTASASSGNAAGAVFVATSGMSAGINASAVLGVPVCFRINAADLGGLIREALNSGGTVRRIQEVKL